MVQLFTAAAVANSYACDCDFELPRHELVLLNAGRILLAGRSELCSVGFAGLVEEEELDVDASADLELKSARVISRYGLGDVFSFQVPPDLPHDRYGCVLELGCHSSDAFEAITYAEVVDLATLGGGPTSVAFDGAAYENLRSTRDTLITTAWDVQVPASGYLLHAWDEVHAEPDFHLWAPVFNSAEPMRLTAPLMWPGRAPKELCFRWELLDPFDAVAAEGTAACAPLRTGCDHGSGRGPWFGALIAALSLRRGRSADAGVGTSAVSAPRTHLPQRELIHTCRLIGVDPYDYLVWALTRLVPHPDNRKFAPSDLTPAAYKATLAADADTS